jgi:isopenicillin-N N-acyltransferase-like protein
LANQQEISMTASTTRREFLQQVAGCGALAAGLPLLGQGHAEEITIPKVPDLTLTLISGKPRERGRQYGQKFKDAIAAFLDREIYQPHDKRRKDVSRNDLLAFAGACGKELKSYAPSLFEEYEGEAEGSGLKLEEVLLLSLHEECGRLSASLTTSEHCTVFAAGSKVTRDGATYIGQNWDWMPSVYGLSSMVHWQRSEGPSVLGYAYPGLWVGAGLNSAGIALCWTSGTMRGSMRRVKGPRVGIPSYALLTHLLYQDTLEGALQEAERAKHAGWFVFVLADGKGQLATVEATPERMVIKRPRDFTANADFACREIVGGPEDKPLQMIPRAQRMHDLLGSVRGKLDRKTLQGFFADHHFADPSDARTTICLHPGTKLGGFTLDSMLFNCTALEAYVERGPACSNRWQTFTFKDK